MSRRERWSWPHAAAAGAFAATSTVYLATRSHAVGFIDRGELAAVATTLGIAHPTGYPTLTLLGHAVTRALPIRPLEALNLLAVALVAGGAAGLALLYEHALARLDRGRGSDGAAAPLRAVWALGGALLTAFTATWWQQANGFEAYALQALLLPLVAWTFLRWVDGGDAPGARVRGWAFAMTLGLAFTNHLTTVVLAPACVAYYFTARGPRTAAVKELLGLVPPFLLGLAPYLYLPLRSAQQPRFDWGDPEQAWQFAAHVTGRQYQVWMFSSGEAARQQLGFFATHLPGELAYVGLALVALGVARLWRSDRRVAAWTLLVMLGSLTFLAGYAIRDVDSYAMPALLALGLCAAAGLSELHARFGTRAALATGVAIAVAAAALHYRACDESANTLAEDYARNQLGALPPRAVLLSSQWDYGVSPSYYLQEVEGVRRDVTVINPELLRRSWYVDELMRRDPWLAERIRPAAAQFVAAVEAFERGHPYQGAEIQRAYEQLLGALVEQARADRRVFVTAELDPAPWRRYVRVPVGLAYEVSGDTTYVPAEFPRYQYRPWRNRIDHYVATQAQIYAECLAARMAYEADHGRVALARRYAEYALTFDPGFVLGEIPALPLDGTALTAQSVRYFQRLRAFVRGVR